MDQCDSLGCTKPAEVEKEIGAPFSMSSTSTKSKGIKKLCGDCAAQAERAEQFGARPTFGRVR